MTCSCQYFPEICPQIGTTLPAPVGGGGVGVRLARTVRMDSHLDLPITQPSPFPTTTMMWHHSVARGPHSETAGRWWSLLKGLVPADIWLMCCFTLFSLGGGGAVWTEPSGTTSLVADPDCSGAVGTGGAGPPILNPSPPVERTLLELYLELIVAKIEFKIYSDSCTAAHENQAVM